MVFADRAYDHDKYRRQVQTVGTMPVIARPGVAHGSGLGQYSWVVEQSFALLHWFRRLRVRLEIRDDIHEAFLRPACAIICFRRMGQPATLLGILSSLVHTATSSAKNARRAGTGRRDSGYVLIRPMVHRSGNFYCPAPPYPLHDLRYSAATLLLEQGVEIIVIKELLGYAHVGVTVMVHSDVRLRLQRQVIGTSATSFAAPQTIPPSPTTATIRALCAAPLH
jgi:hypothetical protein